MYENTCSAMMEEAGDPLLRRAEHHPDPAAKAERLFRLAVTGLSPQPGR
ncbi:hypothetical protein [Nonomuraea longispora]|nr:hypothetical protein [Nonomuraea longispora]